MLEGVKPRPEALLLRRVIMNAIPRFGAPPVPSTTVRICLRLYVHVYVCRGPLLLRRMIACRMSVHDARHQRECEGLCV